MESEISSVIKGKKKYINSLKQKHKNYYSIIKKEIHSYCDGNSGRTALFPAFANSIENKNDLLRRDLVVLVSDILDDLINKGILEISRDCSSEGSVYSFYKINSHEDLVENNDCIKKKMKILS
jgi:hypothetical protein